ncbi:MAG: HAD-IIIC family phosphatase [Oscillospiraceae bacterium]|nr:HAD-IIIC family phosphatase [Oscillospiraceae bacterium]
MEEIMDISAVKLIIWDLDDTFWDGTVSEQSVRPVKKCIDAVILCAEKGIVSAICSKNDEAPCRKLLTDWGVWDYFVFNSINWQPKGQRIRGIISDMNLRAENVLFIDDNHLNLEEAKYYSPELMTASPNIIDELLRDVSALDKSDKSLERLKRYKILEKKQSEKNSMGSNEEFLRQSAIHVEIHSDCKTEIDRIHELILRTNQLNFTKLRSTRDELEAILDDPNIKSGYITAGDKYGDYGIIGFFACRGKKALHFLFSCRTLGMGIEQYIYEQLGFPEIAIEGAVSAEIGADKPRVTWINQSAEPDSSSEISGINGSFRILMKGPCDLLQIFSFIKNEDIFDCEFTYTSEEKHSLGVAIEGMNHTMQIVQSLTLSDNEKAEVCSLPFCDSKMYPKSIYENEYGMIFISILTDVNLGMYKKIGGNQIFAFGEWLYPLTARANWDKYINKEVYTANCRFTREMLESFSKQYEFIGRMTPEMLVENLRFIRENIPRKTELVIMLGCETEFLANKLAAWTDRHNDHIRFNKAVREFAKDYDNITLFDVNEYISSQEDFSDSINHYKKRVYYLMAQRFTEMINSRAEVDIKQTSKLNLAYLSLKQRVKEILTGYR